VLGFAAHRAQEKGGQMTAIVVSRFTRPNRGLAMPGLFNPGNRRGLALRVRLRSDRLWMNLLDLTRLLAGRPAMTAASATLLRPAATLAAARLASVIMAVRGGWGASR
jgi:hypothetical protein